MTAEEAALILNLKNVCFVDISIGGCKGEVLLSVHNGPSAFDAADAMQPLCLSTSVLPGEEFNQGGN